VFGFIADYWSSVGNYPASSQFRAPDGFQWLRHFEMHLPFTATLTIHFPGEARLVIMNAASPVSSRITRMFAPIARNFDLHVPVEDVHALTCAFEEDRLMVETQRPERLPLDLTLEAHIPADRSSIAYRRRLKMGFGDFSSFKWRAIMSDVEVIVDGLWRRAEVSPSGWWRRTADRSRLAAGGAY
jgi:vanillate O-demethylase monooxygenase subunit